MYPHEPHFYIEKLVFAGVYLFFLFLLQNIDCGYLFELPHRGDSNVYPESMFSAKIRKISKISTKTSFFSFFLLQLKNLCILHGHVFVMTGKDNIKYQTKCSKNVFVRIEGPGTTAIKFKVPTKTVVVVDQPMKALTCK